MPRSETIRYIKPEVPAVVLPDYRGEYAETTVPDTLDLAERAALAVNGLTGPTDPGADYEIYWWVCMNQRPVAMVHDFNDHVQAKFLETLPLMRLMSGRMEALDVERRWFEVLLQMQGPHGLIFTPRIGRPWYKDHVYPDFADVSRLDHFASACMCGRYLGAATVYHLLTADDRWLEAARGIARGLRRIAINRDDWAYFAKPVYAPNEPVRTDAPLPKLPYTRIHAAWVSFGLSQYARSAQDDEALDLAVRLARYVAWHSDYYGPDAAFIDNGHFHAHTCGLLAMLQAGLLAGDRELVEFARRGYLWARAKGCAMTGFFPESLVHNPHSTETCAIADMTALALKLSAAGLGDYWDDADRYLRNQLAENQFRWPERLYASVQQFPEAPVDPVRQCADHVAERNVGTFAGWALPNEFVVPPAPLPTPHSAADGPQPYNRGIMHCCTGNATRTLYYAWQHTLTRSQDKVTVNLLLNHDSPWAEIHSHVPYTGRVDVRMKETADLAVRIPEWAERHDVTVCVDGERASATADGRFLIVGKVREGRTVTMEFPLPARSVSTTIAGKPYTLELKGNEVIAVSPAGTFLPLYERQHCRANETQWKDVPRFVSSRRISW